MLSCYVAIPELGHQILGDYLDDDRPEETEAQNDVPWNRWRNLVAIQSEVPQSRSTVGVDIVIQRIR